MMKRKNKSVCFRVEAKRYSDVVKLASSLGMTASSLVRMVLFDYLRRVDKNGKTLQERRM